ncbi:MAG: DNA-3-methyladenine glycosylase family protein [Limisphaerales bacterium]
MMRTVFPVRDYDLAATLTCGQAFRWRPVGEGWEAVVDGRWVRLEQAANEAIHATVTEPVRDWNWLRNYLRLDDDLAGQLATFPEDAPLRAAVAHGRGLRLLRQEPWECLASFILSSTKQIVQIRQCVELLCTRFGEPVAAPAPDWFRFPSPERLAAASEAELRACKLGFRAKYLRATAQRLVVGEPDLAALPGLPLATARAALMTCPGVGRKIADCVLLFSLGFDAAFPIDVWVERALRELYFPRRRVRRARLEQFAASHFGPHAGLAQQYLFHYLRTRQPVVPLPD